VNFISDGKIKICHDFLKPIFRKNTVKILKFLLKFYSGSGKTIINLSSSREIEKIWLPST